MRVLIADDDRAFAEYLTALVWACGHEVAATVTAGGLAVLQSFRQHCPDLLLLDVMMPQFNGFTVCQQILSRDPLARVILMSGLIAAEYPSITSSRASAFIRKPFTFQEIETLLHSVALEVVAPEALQLHNLRAMDVRLGEQLLEQRRAGNRVEIQHSERPAARFIPAERHACNIHVMPAHESAEVADDSWPVAVLQEENHA